jgi:hypothetical protein
MFWARRARPVRKAEKRTTLCEPTVQTMRNPQHAIIL